MADNSYDETPYASYPYPQTQPQRLGTIASLMGLGAPPVERARVLELGCCSGGNLIPLAERNPAASFLGIDASERQIEEGRSVVQALGLRNIELRHADIRDVSAGDGAFDYIMAHGVYSWVPPDVQDKMLSICGQQLTENGVAYVSYNTYPGWRMRGIIRDIMLYRARHFRRPADRVGQARSLVDFLAHSVAAEDSAYGMLLRRELELLDHKADHYLLHEHLEEHNEPLYFSQFIERCAAHKLQYLGEADFGSMAGRNLPTQVEAVLQGVAGDLIELEQYQDFLRNRMFRQTLLCGEGASLDRRIGAERVLIMHVSSPARAEGPIGDLRSREKLTFRGSGAVTTTTEPLVKAALAHLGEIWPASVPFAELLALAQSRLSAVASVVDGQRAGMDAARLGEPLMRCYASGQVELSVCPAYHAARAGARPRAGAYARRQAEIGPAVTNLRHETVRLGDFERHVLRLLDGQRDRSEILWALGQMAASGAVVVHQGGERVSQAERAAQLLEEPLEPALGLLARQALLLG